MLINLMTGILPQCIHISSHHTVYFKYTTIVFVYYTCIYYNFISNSYINESGRKEEKYKWPSSLIFKNSTLKHQPCI